MDVLTTTITELKEYDACESGLRTLIASLPKDHSPDSPITLAHILESNGLEHAIWALRTQEKKLAVKFAELCAKRAKKAFEYSAAIRYAVDARAARTSSTASAYARYTASSAATDALDIAGYYAERKEQEKIYLKIVSCN